MSTIDYPTPYQPTAERPARSVATAVVGGILVVIGFLTAASGGALLYLFGGAGTVSSGPHLVSTPTSALITDLGTITNTNGVSVAIASPTMHVAATGSENTPVFVGIGPADAVENYLRNTATDHVTDLELSPFHLNTNRHDGSTVATPPAEQSFWVASAQSTNNAEVNWQIQDGRYDVVIMNADGTADVRTSAEIGVGLPHSTGIWLLVVGVGIIFMVGGAAVIIVGAQRRNG